MRASFRAVLTSGGVAAVAEMMAVLPIQAALGVTPLRVFQSIASGIEGRRAYAGGMASAVLGAALHLSISLGAALVFHLASRRWAWISRHPVVAGLTYGVVVYSVMRYVVLPLSAVAYKPASAWPMVATSLAVHAFFFGLPLSLVDRRFQALSRPVGGGGALESGEEARPGRSVRSGPGEGRGGPFRPRGPGSRTG